MLYAYHTSIVLLYKMSDIIQFKSLLNTTIAEAEKFCNDCHITPFNVYVEPNNFIVPEHMTTTPNRAQLAFYLDANDVYRVGKAVIYQNGEVLTTVTTDDCGNSCDGVHAKVFSVHTLLNMTQEEVKEYCISNKVVHYTVYADPTYIGTPYNVQTMSPNRVEIRLRNHVEYGKNIYRVFSADYYRDNILVDSLKGDNLEKPTAKVDSAQEKRIQYMIC